MKEQKSTTRRSTPRIEEQPAIGRSLACLTLILAEVAAAIPRLDDATLAAATGSPEHKRVSHEMKRQEEIADALQNAMMRLPAASLSDALVLAALAGDYANAQRTGGYSEETYQERGALMDEALRSIRGVLEREIGTTALAMGFKRYLPAEEAAQ